MTPTLTSTQGDADALRLPTLAALTGLFMGLVALAAAGL